MRDSARVSARRAVESIAQLLWEQFGDEAARYAARRLSAVPDGERRRQWRAVLERLSELIAGAEGGACRPGGVTPPRAVPPPR